MINSNSAYVNELHNLFFLRGISSSDFFRLGWGDRECPTLIDWEPLRCYSCSSSQSPGNPLFRASAILTTCGDLMALLRHHSLSTYLLQTLRWISIPPNDLIDIDLINWIYFILFLLQSWLLLPTEESGCNLSWYTSAYTFFEV